MPRIFLAGITARSGQQRRHGGGGLVERAGRRGGYTRIPFGTIDDVTDAPQAGYVLTWREDTDNLICLMIIRWGGNGEWTKGERRMEGKRRKKPPNKKSPNKKSPNPCICHFFVVPLQPIWIRCGTIRRICRRRCGCLCSPPFRASLPRSLCALFPPPHPSAPRSHGA